MGPEFSLPSFWTCTGAQPQETSLSDWILNPVLFCMCLKDPAFHSKQLSHKITVEGRDWDLGTEYIPAIWNGIFVYDDGYQAAWSLLLCPCREKTLLCIGYKKIPLEFAFPAG